jgi:hypothetical protein
MQLLFADHDASMLIKPCCLTSSLLNSFTTFLDIDCDARCVPTHVVHTNSPALKQNGLQLCPAKVDSCCMGSWAAANNNHVCADLLYKAPTVATVEHNKAMVLSEFCNSNVPTCRADCRGRSLAALLCNSDPRKRHLANEEPSLPAG